MENQDFAGRKVRCRKRGLARPLSDACQPIGAPCIEERVLGQGARRDDADNVATNDRLGAALPGLGRVFHLLTDRHAKPCPDQLGQVAFRRMGGHPRHGDILSTMLAAIGERNANRLRRLARVVKEQLVEIAHAKENQGVRVTGLGIKILLHDRRGAGGVEAPARFVRWGGVLRDGSVAPHQASELAIFRLASIASHISAVASTPENRFSCWAPVGDVTLISVR